MKIKTFRVEEKYFEEDKERKYEDAKSRLRRDINSLPQRYSTTAYLNNLPIPCTLDRHAAPKQLILVDFSCFKKSKEEKLMVLNHKMNLPKTRCYKFRTFFKGSY